MIAFTRRTMLAGLSGLVITSARSETVWPNRPIKLVHGYAPGGPTDTVARIVAEGLSKRLGQSVVVDPRSGASGTIAAAQVSHAAPDGYTLIAIPGGHATAAAIYQNLPYRTVDDFSMISMTAEYPFVVATYIGHAIRTVRDLISAHKTPLLYGTPGAGSLHHLAVELLARTANVAFEPVPYRGSAQIVPDLLGKRIDFMLDPPTLLVKFIRDGSFRALGVTGPTRFFSLPDIPTFSEAGVPGYSVTSWQGLAGPAGMSPSIVERLNREVAAVLAEPAVIDQLRALGNDPRPCSPDEFRARIMADVEKWTNVVAAAGIERI
jgi:tripartite-type tricarboxylate transporter receptor subunit TctC